mmetsp:Transcript_32936/g.104282  ORF Transcript_32936/g.104282 Transcript_32936/m.104282 type:complete len:424 (-) Transcript_32936:89-1360(-)
MVAAMGAAGVNLKLRSLRPLLHYYARHGLLEDCVGVFRDMQRRGFEISELDYVFTFRCCCDAEGVAAAAREGHFAFLFGEFREDVLRPEKQLVWPVLRRWYEGHGRGGEVQVMRVDATGWCAATEERLRSVEPTEEHRAAIVAKLEEYVKVTVKHRRAWDRFHGWLERANRAPAEEKKKEDGSRAGATETDGDGAGEAPGLKQEQRCKQKFKQRFETAGEEKPKAKAAHIRRREFDTIVDGANIGYFRQNFKGAPKHINYHQLDAMLQELRALGRKSLLVLHRRHLAKNLMPEWAEAFIRKWRDQELFYIVEPGNNDDWYWMLASITYTRASPVQMWVVTNDLMRDHHFQMLSQRSFNRWRERHQVYYDLIGSERYPRVELRPPLPYSHRTQQLERFVYVPNASDDEWLVARRVASRETNSES